MQISGQGIDSPITVKIKTDYRPIMTLALKWAQASNGSWNASDHESSADIYDVENLNLYSKEPKLNEFFENIEDNRNSTIVPDILILSEFNGTEMPFGVDIDYSGDLTAAITGIDRRRQGSLKGWGVTLRMRLLSPFSFVSGGPYTLPEFRHLEVGYDGDSIPTVGRIFSYNNTPYFSDPISDSGSFTGTFVFTHAEMTQLRRYAAVERGSSFALTNIAGVKYPFGISRHNATGGYPYVVKLIKIEDEKLFGVHHWKCKVTFGEVFE